MNQEIKKLKEEIDKIKRVLINYEPKYFKRELCSHEIEKVSIRIDDPSLTYPYKDTYSCKKCGLFIDIKENPIIQKV